MLLGKLEGMRRKERREFSYNRSIIRQCREGEGGNNCHITPTTKAAQFPALTQICMKQGAFSAILPSGKIFLDLLFFDGILFEKDYIGTSPQSEIK